MIRYDTETTIKGSVDEVFRWIAEADRHEHWMDIFETRSLTLGPMQAGSRLEGVIRKGPFRWKLPYEVTELVPGRRFGYRTSPGSRLRWTGFFDVEPVEGRTRVRSAGDLSLAGFLRLFEPLMVAEVRNGEAKERSASRLSWRAAADPLPLARRRPRASPQRSEADQRSGAPAPFRPTSLPSPASVRAVSAIATRTTAIAMSSR